MFVLRQFRTVHDSVSLLIFTGQYNDIDITLICILAFNHIKHQQSESVCNINIQFNVLHILFPNFRLPFWFRLSMLRMISKKLTSRPILCASLVMIIIIYGCVYHPHLEKFIYLQKRSEPSVILVQKQTKYVTRNIDEEGSENATSNLQREQQPGNNTKKCPTTEKCQSLQEIGTTAPRNHHSPLGMWGCVYDKVRVDVFSKVRLTKVSLCRGSVTDNNKHHDGITLFTTMQDSPYKMGTWNNTLHMWARLRPFVKPVLFTDTRGRFQSGSRGGQLASEACRLGWDVYAIPLCNQDGYPVLKAMFQVAQNVSMMSNYMIPAL